MIIRNLDLSENRIEGARGGQAIARIIKRQNEKYGGQNLQVLTMGHNKLGSAGFLFVAQALALPTVGVFTSAHGFPSSGEAALPGVLSVCMTL